MVWLKIRNRNYLISLQQILMALTVVFTCIMPPPTIRMFSVFSSTSFSSNSTLPPDHKSVICHIHTKLVSEVLAEIQFASLFKFQERYKDISEQFSQFQT